MVNRLTLDRRTFLVGMLGASGVAAGARMLRSAEKSAAPRSRICAFVKFVQSLPPAQLAETIGDLGFDGIEATVRPGGQVPPERVEEDLPELVEALKDRGLDVTVMTTNVTRADEPLAEKVLRTAAKLGIRRYRMGYFRYDLSRPVVDQLEELRGPMKELAALNREIGMTAVYQNHAGPGYVGASIWDLHRLIHDVPAGEIGIAFDIRHATVEGGTTWPVLLNVAGPHLGAVYVKDFRWKGRRPENVPLGAGQVDPAFVEHLRRMNYHGPISLHVEYLERAGVPENVAALRDDLQTLRKWLQS